VVTATVLGESWCAFVPGNRLPDPKRWCGPEERFSTPLGVAWRNGVSCLSVPVAARGWGLRVYSSIPDAAHEEGAATGASTTEPESVKHHQIEKEAGERRSTRRAVAATLGGAGGTSAMLLAFIPAGSAMAEENVPEPRDTDRVCDDAEDYENPFADLTSDNVHYRNIFCAADEGIIRGSADETLRPARRILRDQMASFIARWVEQEVGENLDDSDAGFEDILAGNVHEDSINKLANAEIVLGRSEISYGPSDSVTRQVTTALLHRARSYIDDGNAQNLSSPPPADEDYFPDVDEDNPFFVHINTFAEYGTASGYADGDFGPGDLVRRDQMASFLMRAFDQLGHGDYWATVTVTSPTSDNPDTVETGENVAVEFVTTQAVGGAYTVELGHHGEWIEVDSGDIATAGASTTVNVPGDADEGAYDLRVRVTDPDGRQATDTQEGAVIVVDGVGPDSHDTVTSSDTGGAGLMDTVVSRI
jgi:hypothetical protein